jgi:hypothetical protein
MGTVILLILAAAVGYVGAVYTWPSLRVWLVGIEHEIDDLRAKARALEARLRG